VTYDLRKGPLTWNLVGKSIVIDDSISSCSTSAHPKCATIAPSALKSLYREFLRTVRSTISAGEKTMRHESGRKLTKTSQASGILKQLLRLVLQQRDVLICEPGALIPRACKTHSFPHKTILKLHKQIFAKAQLSNPKAFEKIRKTYHNHYAEYLKQSFPSKVYRCPLK
jgi:hypothetical protein